MAEYDITERLENTTEQSTANNSAAETPVPTSSETPAVAETSSTAPAPASEATPASTDKGSDGVNYALLLFRDGNDFPIADMEWFVTLPSGDVCTAKSSAQGAIAVELPPGASGEAKVEVKDHTGKRQEVCTVDVAQCKAGAIIRSPKVVADATPRPHQQPAPAAKKAPPPAPAPAKKPENQAGKTEPAKVNMQAPWQDAWAKALRWLSTSVHLPAHSSAGNGTASAKPAETAPPATLVTKTLSTAGQPVTVVAGPECPNKDCLFLGRNNVYRTAILDAAKRLGLIPQALCALMDCEAGKVKEVVPLLGPDGKQLKDKKGKLLSQTLHELWNANAGNAESGAAGLTQFLGSTWLSHVMRPGFYIHTQSVANNWVRQDKDKKGNAQRVFVLADGTTTTTPYNHRSSDANVKKCLAMRMDPTWSINAAADYGNANLKVLETAGFKLKGLNDMDKAKLMYLMHHEGEGNGPLFIKNTLAKGRGGVAGLRKTFVLQLGGNGEALVKARVDKADGDVEVAYRLWLATYIDDTFRPASRYFCKDPKPMKDLTDLLELVGGKAIE
jgi:hypothetical protein